MKPEIRLSQCMIVKNEEKNIRTALSWGKKIVCEQIVVDTGSTDRTVEIAEEMGAKVFHFAWIEDFSAAKNFAIEQASGDWIAFLDADEYFNQEDSEKLMTIIQNSAKQLRNEKLPGVIRSAWLQLDDSGKIFSTSVQDRIFMNAPGLRYQNKIHENLKYKETGQFILIDASKSLSIYHTGYSHSSYQKSGKIDRNINMLQKELEANPSDNNLWSYLGDSLLAAKRIDEAEQAYEKGLSETDHGHFTIPSRRNIAFSNLMKIIIFEKNDPAPAREERLLNLYQRFTSYQMDYPDIEYLMGIWMLMQNKEVKAAQWLELSLEKYEHYKGAESLALSGKLYQVYKNLALIYEKKGDFHLAVKNSILSLRLDKYQPEVLERLLTFFLTDKRMLDEPGASSVHKVLGKIYDYQSLKDKLFLIKASKKTGYHSLEKVIMSSLKPEEKEWLQRPEEANLKNVVDRSFSQLMSEVRTKSLEELKQNIRGRLNEMKVKNPKSYSTLVDYYARFSFWGQLLPDQKIFDALDNRAIVLKHHLEDFLWLYTKLGDYRSKKTLLSVLANWLYLTFINIEELYLPYFDLDLIPDCNGKVFADLGAFTGDTVAQFVTSYGTGYKRIYSYEPTPYIVKILTEQTQSFHDMVIRPKAASSGKGLLYLSENENSSANKLSSKGSIQVETVSLDEDISEPISFIKMDIEGAEHEALLGCRGHIIKEHPHLAVSVYHGYDQLWDIPRLIEGISPDYRFYLRYYGGNLFSTELVLYAL